MMVTVMILYIISLSVNTEEKLECKCGVFVSQFSSVALLSSIQFFEFAVEKNIKQTRRRACMPSVTHSKFYLFIIFKLNWMDVKV